MLLKTVNELADDLKLDYATAQGLVKFLVEKKLATKAGTRPTTTGKGKPSNVYELPERVEISLKAE